MADQRQLFSVGHSNHPLPHFLELLRSHTIDVLVDVRSAPYSQYSPHYNKVPLQEAVTHAGFRYVFLGRELGGRPAGAEFYDEDGYVRYDRLAASPLFLAGIQRLEKGIQQFRLALMCSEEDPTSCHRRLLLARVLTGRGIETLHIRGDGRVLSETDLTSALKDGKGEGRQLSLLDEVQEPAWKSARSVLPKSQPQLSSER